MTNTETTETITYKVRIATRDSRQFRALVKACHNLDATFDSAQKLWTVSDNCIKFRVERNAVDDLRNGPNAAYHTNLGHVFDDFDPVAYMTSLGLTVVEVVS